MIKPYRRGIPGGCHRKSLFEHFIPQCYKDCGCLNEKRGTVIVDMKIHLPSCNYSLCLLVSITIKSNNAFSKRCLVNWPLNVAIKQHWCQINMDCGVILLFMIITRCFCLNLKLKSFGWPFFQSKLLYQNDIINYKEENSNSDISPD